MITAILQVLFTFLILAVPSCTNALAQEDTEAAVDAVMEPFTAGNRPGAIIGIIQWITMKLLLSKNQ